MTKALIIVAQGFQDEEFVYPYYRMKEEGWEVEVAAPFIGVVGKYGVPARASRTFNDLAKYNGAWDIPYDVLIIPGGYESPDRLREIQFVKSLVWGMNSLKRTIGAICHGPWVLISAKVVAYRKLTAYPSMRDDVINANGLYQDDVDVVVDHNIVTSPHYRNNGAFMRAVIETEKNKAGWNEAHASTF